MAPNYDNKIALISRGYPSDVTRRRDGLIRFFREFVDSNDAAREMYRRMELPEITPEMIDEIMESIPIDVDRSFVRDFVLNGQSAAGEIVQGCQ